MNSMFVSMRQDCSIEPVLMQCGARILDAPLSLVLSANKWPNDDVYVFGFVAFRAFGDLYQKEELISALNLTAFLACVRARALDRAY